MAIHTVNISNPLNLVNLVFLTYMQIHATLKGC